MEIKKGQKFRCIKDVVMCSGYVEFYEGAIYTSANDGCITNNSGDVGHMWDDDIETWEHFELYEPEGYWADGSPKKAKFQIGDLVIPIKSKTHPWKPIPVFRIEDVVLNDDSAFEYKAVLDMEANTGRFGTTSFKENELEAYTPKEYDKEDEDFSFQDIADGNEAEGVGYREFETGSRRDSDAGKPRVADLKAYTRLRFGYRMLIGSEKYGEGNFELGQPNESTLKSLHRHLAQFELGDDSEDHMSAVLFGVQMIMLEQQRAGVSIDHYYTKHKNND